MVSGTISQSISQVLNFQLGLDGVVMLWDTVTGECLFRITDAFGGAVSTLTWVERLDEEEQWPPFCYGNASGHIVGCVYLNVSPSLK